MSFYYSCTSYTSGSSWKDPMKHSLSVLPPFRPSVLPSFRLSGCFLRIGSLDLCDVMYGATNPYDVVHNRAVIFEKDFSHSKN